MEVANTCTTNWWNDDEVDFLQEQQQTSSNDEELDFGLDVLSLNDEEPPQYGPELHPSIFTNSGNNFIFGDLQPMDTKPDGAEAPVEVKVEISKEQTSPANDAAASSSPQPDDDHKLNEINAFIDSFRQEGRCLSSAIVNLDCMLKNFPEYVYIEHNEEGDLEIHFVRDKLLKALRNEEERFPALVFTSFERGLKHAGMEVTQSTHGQTQIKKWAMKKGFVPKPPGSSKRSKKRKELSDDDYDDTKRIRKGDKIKA